MVDLCVNQLCKLLNLHMFIVKKIASNGAYKIVFRINQRIAGGQELKRAMMEWLIVRCGMMLTNVILRQIVVLLNTFVSILDSIVGSYKQIQLMNVMEFSQLNQLLSLQ